MDANDLRVLYVTDRCDAPYRYRCLHPCLQLRAEGVACDILHIRDERLSEHLSRHSVIILFRLPWSAHVEALVTEAREHGAALVFDVDDLVFDPALCSSLPFLVNAPKILRLQYENSAARLLRTFEACDVLIGATPAIARAAVARAKRAFVHPNLLHPGFLQTARCIHALRMRMQRKPIIAYMSGSMTHNEDFAIVAGVLTEIMSRRRDVLLMIGGFLEHEIADGLGGLVSDRIIRLPFQDWRVQPWSMNLARVNVAPLAAVNEFTNSKSALKFFEAAAIGLPTVATPTEPYQAAITHGVDGYLADDPDTWYQSIVACLDAEVARRVGDAARRTALREHSHAGHRHRLRDILLSMNGRAAKPYSKPRPVPAENPDVEHAPSRPRRWLSRAARARAVFGVIRRVRKPASLSRPDACRDDHMKPGAVVVDPPMENLEAALSMTPPGGTRIERDGRLIALQVFATPQPFGPWCLAADVRGLVRGDAGDWMTCQHKHPMISSPTLDIAPAPFKALLVRLAVSTHAGEARARLLWRTTTAGRFTEKTCVQLPVICDGRSHCYVVRLTDQAWPDGGAPIRALRVDPLDVPGDFRLDLLVLLVDEHGTFPDARQETR